jgi:RND family efflux transporter MFP subunit
MKTVFIIIGIMLIVGVSYLFYFSKQARHDDPVYVEYYEVKRGTFVSSISATGKIISRKVETVKATSYGIILDAGYQNLSAVKKNTVIARIRMDERDLQKKQQQLKLAEIDLQLIREQRLQGQELFQAKAISERELKEIKIREYKQEVYVQDINEEIADKEIIASFDGVIMNKKFNHLDRVFNGTELFTLVDIHDICVELLIFQEDISKVSVGQKVILSSNTFNGQRQGIVTEISTLADQSNAQNYRQNTAVSFNVYSSINILPEDQILFGSNVDSKVVLDEIANTISVPLEAILYRDAGRVVYIIQNDKAIAKVVETGKYSDDFVEIISGLSEKEKVITRGNLDVENGTKIINQKLGEQKKRRKSGNQVIR